MTPRRNHLPALQSYGLNGRLGRLVLALLLSTRVFAVTAPSHPPRTWTWEEITQDFATLAPDRSDFSERDGALMKNLNPAGTLTFLLPFLAKDRPQGVRLNALYALRAAALPESARVVEGIALDLTEDPRVRYSALWPFLTKFDKTRAADIGLTCLRDKERTVRLGAYWLVGQTGGTAVIDALKERFFLAAEEKQLALQALGNTKDPAAIKFLVEHSPIDHLRSDKDWRDNFVRAMAATPIAEAQPTMLALMNEGDHLLRAQALPYFRALPSAEVGPCIVDYFNDPKTRRGLKTYADVWFFANSPALTEESKEPLRERVKETYLEAVFDKVASERGEVDDDTLGAVIKGHS
jgi:hypothetical protein